MDADLDTLATALYVRTDDLLKAAPERAPARPVVGIAPRMTDAELVTLAVMQALLDAPARPTRVRLRVAIRHHPAVV
ncbi:MAG: transposase [Streptosporangiaceae bacterium]|nr:transposase [Streptosporangiaceae bacterium]